MPAVSCCIITKNEAHNIERCIAAVKDVVDEVVVVDSGSTDATVDKARAMGARVIHRDFDGYGPQKRFAEDCAEHDWILNLDADEVASQELAAEIAAFRRSEPALPAYRVRMPTVYPGHSRPRLFADAHNYVRLYDRRRVRFSPSPVHDTVDLGDCPAGQMLGVALHYSWPSVEVLAAKMERYAALQAKVLKKPRWIIWLRLPFEYPQIFLRYYLLRANWTGGLTGLRVAHVTAKVKVGRLLKMLRAASPGPA